MSGESVPNGPEVDSSKTVVQPAGPGFSSGSIVSGQMQITPAPGDPKLGGRNRFKLVAISVVASVILLVGLSILVLSILNTSKDADDKAINNASQTETNADVSSKVQASDNKSQQSASPVESPADAERKADINAIHAQAEAHFNQTGAYPTLAELTNASYRKANLNGLSEAILMDPAGSELISSSATTSHYGYVAPKTASCPSGRVSVCNQYVLTAILSNGQSYTKQSLN